MRYGCIKPVLLVSVLLLAGAVRAEGVTVRAQLVLASRDPLPTDARLERIEHRLRRVFDFDYFQQIGEGQATLRLPGEVTLALGEGYSLIISARRPKDGKARTLVRWLRGNELLMETSLKMGKGKPAVLGGPPHEGGNLIVVLRAQ